MVEQIYVRLLNEGIDVWRPVKAAKLSDNHFLILLENEIPEGETWEYLPGSVVLVINHKSNDEPIKAAIRKLQEEG